MFRAMRQCNTFLKLSSSHLIRNGPLSAFFCTESEPPPRINFEEITKGDAELEHKLKVLILEVDVLRQEGKAVPEDRHLKQQHWAELLELPSYSARRKFLEFLFKISKRKENKELKKEEKRMNRVIPEKKKENETFEEFVSQYDLSHNTLFLRIYETTINQMYNNRLVQAMQFGQKLVVDLGYDDKMTRRENKNCAKQLTLLFAENRAHDDPYDLHFCNINPQGVIMEQLGINIGTLHDSWFPLNLHEESYLDIFPKDQLVYLTPHCREELVDYDHDAVYIIGGIVDKVNQEPLSLAKAKKEGLRMAKFPLDRYLQWGSGSGKSLTLNQTASILLDVKHTGDWKFALRHVPRRKIAEVPELPQRMTRAWKPSNTLNLDRLSYRNAEKRSNNPDRSRRPNVRTLYEE